MSDLALDDDSLKEARPDLPPPVAPGARAPRMKAKTKAKAKLKTSAVAEHKPPAPADAVHGGRASFLVRIWHAEEGGDAAQPSHVGWHGVVEHIQSGSRISFEDEVSLFVFMTEQARRQQSQARDFDEFDRSLEPADD